MIIHNGEVGTTERKRVYNIWALRKITINEFQLLQLILGENISSRLTRNSAFTMEANLSKPNVSQGVFPNTLMNRSMGQVVADVGPLFLINLTALFGNTLLCIAFIKNNHLRSVTNIFVLTLAVSDIVMSLTCMPLSEGSLLAGEWIFGDLLCHIQGFLAHFLAFLSLEMMAITAANRYFRVIKQDLYKKIFTPGYTTLIILSASLLSVGILASITFAQHGNLFVFHPGKAICVNLYRSLISTQIYTIFSSVTFVSLPAIVIIWCYTKVFRSIRRHFRRLAARKMSSASINSMNPAEIVVTRTVFAIVIGFFICWIPCIVIDLVDITRDAWFDRRVYLAYTYFAYTSSAINPIIYGIMNRSFRVEYLKLLKCR